MLELIVSRFETLAIATAALFYAQASGLDFEHALQEVIEARDRVEALRRAEQD